MKKTIKEVYDLIVEKRDNAERNTNIVINKEEKMLLAGQCQAYIDVLCLLESSHLLEEDKPIKGSGLEIIENKIKDLMECVNECRTNGLEYSRLDDEIAELKIIGKELKRLESIEDDYNRVVEDRNWYKNAYEGLGLCNKEDEKSLKALEIIKEKNVQVDTLLYMIDTSTKPREDYNINTEFWLGYREIKQLTQEEYNLLKEVLL